MSTVNPPDDWSDLEEEVQASQTVDELKAKNIRLARQLHETKHKQADYLSTLWSAVTDSINGQVIRPVKAPPVRKAGTGKPEVAIALLSDLQTGKITPTYNSKICAERVARYADKIIELTRIQEKDHPVRKCVVAGLGDMVEGVDIFPGQQWLIDSTLYTQLLDTTPVIVVDFIRRLLTYFDEVVLEAVDGNHGRIGRKGQYGPMDNADRMVYRIVQMMLRDEPRFSMNMTDPEGERNWYRIMELGNYRALLFHGDQIKPTMGFPYYGLGKKIQGWGSGGLGPGVEFTDAFLGHWHQAASIPLNHLDVYVNGSTESSNTFAQEYLAAQSLPKQWLLFCNPEKGRITATYKVDLSGEGEVL